MRSRASRARRATGRARGQRGPEQGAALVVGERREPVDGTLLPSRRSGHRTAVRSRRCPAGSGALEPRSSGGRTEAADAGRRAPTAGRSGTWGSRRRARRCPHRTARPSRACGRRSRGTTRRCRRARDSGRVAVPGQVPPGVAGSRRAASATSWWLLPTMLGHPSGVVQLVESGSPNPAANVSTGAPPRSRVAVRDDQAAVDTAAEVGAHRDVGDERVRDRRVQRRIDRVDRLVGGGGRRCRGRPAASSSAGCRRDRWCRPGGCGRGGACGPRRRACTARATARRRQVVVEAGRVDGQRPPAWPARGP